MVPLDGSSLSHYSHTLCTVQNQCANLSCIGNSFTWKSKKKKKKIGPRLPEMSDRNLSNTLQTDTIEVPGRKLSIPVRSINHLKRGLR